MAEEYIKRILAKAEFTGNFRDEYPTALIHALIDSVPTADVQPVRHGRWELDVLDGTPGYRPVCIVCSECHRINYGSTPYCPNCGCAMEDV